MYPVYMLLMKTQQVAIGDYVTNSKEAGPAPGFFTTIITGYLHDGKCAFHADCPVPYLRAVERVFSGTQVQR